MAEKNIKENNKTNSSNKTVWWILGGCCGCSIILAILFVIFFVFQWFLPPTWWVPKNLINSFLGPTPAASSTPQSSISPTTDLNNSNGNFYGNEKYHYSLYYPTSFKIKNQSTNLDIVKIYSDSEDTQTKGVLITISNISNPDNYYDIKQYINNMPVGDPEGAAAKATTEYIGINGSTVAKITDNKNNMINYEWICGGKILNLNYRGNDFAKYLPTFNLIINSLVPCAG